MTKGTVKGRMKFRVDEFDRWAATMDLKTIADKARFCESDPGHFWRVYYGKKRPGGIFAARVLGADWPGPKRPDFQDFFEFEVAA